MFTLAKSAEQIEVQCIIFAHVVLSKSFAIFWMCILHLWVGKLGVNKEKWWTLKKYFGIDFLKKWWSVKTSRQTERQRRKYIRSSQQVSQLILYRTPCATLHGIYSFFLYKQFGDFSSKRSTNFRSMITSKVFVLFVVLAFVCASSADTSQSSRASSGT